MAGANRSAQDYLSSGEINDIKVGGIADENKVVLHGDHGLVNYGLATPSVASLTTSFAKIAMIDATLLNHAHGHMSVDIVNDRMIINTDSVYKIDVAASISGANNAEITFAFYKNGIKASGLLDPIWVTRGITKPVQINTSQPFELVATDYIEIWAKADATQDITIEASSITMQKKPY